MSDYVQLKNLQGQPLKPVTDLAAINMTTTNGIQVVPANGGTIGITSGYINSAYYVDMVSEDVGPASTSSAYIEGGTATLITGAYTVTSAINSSTPSQQKVPSEAAVVSALDNVVTSGTSYYAGTGIAIDAGHTVSVSGVPTSAVAGLDTQLTNINAAVAAKQDAISAGYRMSLDGTTLNQQRYFPVKDTGTSATITLEAGSAYKIQATTGSKTLTAETVSAGMFGLEGHAEIFIAGAGLIKTTSNVILAQPLEPDSVNNCTVRFHDGRAIISVEDHIAGYIVMVNATSGSGSLNYALGVSTEYISVDASLNGQTLDLAGAVTNGEKHVVGNGYTETIISGGINCTSKTTLSNLAADGVIVSSGTLTLGDVFIPSGSTVAVSGGGLAIEKVTGNGGDSVIDLNNHSLDFSNKSGTITGCVISGGSASNVWGDILVAGNTGKVAIHSSVITRNTGGGYGVVGAITSGTIEVSHSEIRSNYNGLGNGCIAAYASTNVLVVSSYITENNAWQGGGIYGQGASIVLSGTTVTGNTQRDTQSFGSDIYLNGGIMTAQDSKLGACQIVGSAVLVGSNSVEKMVGTGKVILHSGATLDLTGNTNAEPIAPGGGITFEEGGATVYPSAGQASAYMLGGTALTIGNTNNVAVDRIMPTHVSGCTVTFQNEFVPYIQNGASATYSDCALSTPATEFLAATYGGASGTVVLGGTVSFNKAVIGADDAAVANITILDGATIVFTAQQSIGYPIRCKAGTLTVGSNCTIVTYGSSYLINGGTATTGKNLEYDGSVI